MDLAFKRPAMFLPKDYQPEFESLSRHLLELAQIRSPVELLRSVVQRLGERPHVALARIWLIEKCDRFGSCQLWTLCAHNKECLHLVASAGRSVAEPEANWSRLDGRFSRIPMGSTKVGQVGSTGQACVLRDIDADPSTVSDSAWAIREEIRALDAQPIIHDGRVLGVLAAFLRTPIHEAGPVWLRILADHIAVALTNARAFEEIERLKSKLEQENTYLREEVREAKAFGEILGQSAQIHQLRRQIEMVAPTDAAVLISGESGTGKELVAREIHKRSRRNNHPLIRVNCASVPRELYESEFFGHVKGAFTGAIKDRIGRFAAADGGTLFLDEIGEIPLELQSKFLRVLQEKQYERVGEDKTRTINVRIIAATNRDLKHEIALGRFRQDLFYRINVFPIEVAPLRNRREDVLLLARHFLSDAARRLKLSSLELSADHLRTLQNHDWPGNVRELQNVIERALILAQNGRLEFDLPPSARETTERVQTPAPEGKSSILTEAERHERDIANLLSALTKARWKIHGTGGAAELLGLKPTTLLSRMKKLGVKKSG